LLLSLVLGINEAGSRDQPVMMSSHIKQLAFWHDSTLWQRIFNYYCDCNHLAAVEEGGSGKDRNTGIFTSMIGFFMKQEIKEPEYSEEIRKKSIHDVEHLLFKMEFPFEHISTVILRLAKKYYFLTQG
jgi:hypothetical protein